MTLQDCYTEMLGDYDDVVSRLRNDRIIEKFVLKFLDDKSFNLLCQSLEEKQYDEAFRAAHTIKGICQNLSFNQLSKSSSDLTEALRNGQTDHLDDLFKQVDIDYQRTFSAIKKYKEEK